MTRLWYYDMTGATEEDWQHFLNTGTLPPHMEHETWRFIGCDPEIPEGHAAAADKHAMEIELQGLADS